MLAISNLSYKVLSVDILGLESIWICFAKWNEDQKDEEEVCKDLDCSRDDDHVSVCFHALDFGKYF